MLDGKIKTAISLIKTAWDKACGATPEPPVSPEIDSAAMAIWLQELQGGDVVPGTVSCNGKNLGPHYRNLIEGKTFDLLWPYPEGTQFTPSRLPDLGTEGSIRDHLLSDPKIAGRLSELKGDQAVVGPGDDRPLRL